MMNREQELPMSAWDHLVIAQRELRRSGAPILVSIGLPYKEGPRTWAVSFRIEGIEEEPLEETVRGADSAEALISALRTIAAVIDSWNADHSITWNGRTDLGFSP
ncbi:hypothetical protein A5780_32215 [Nocardia sp. 852002-20019_SCH5090214]|jgi:hypothetical protein|nr:MULTISPECIES: hypothetical protein [Nocardia]HWB95967.1 hypothetical protein [Bryobacteraceae bacterium]MDN2495630.1 hypothetical protein [Nocardia nova]OBA49579.1 hypothetical protein A5780_32215 [Nocardia sp. 852002-20019_SCH5090214]PPJ01468.1 hypothetical protein C5E51_33540 [Nocardia nova]PPJ03247.1 hypothetical protein C5E44_34575 [Nocardia nova]